MVVTLDVFQFPKSASNSKAFSKTRVKFVMFDVFHSPIRLTERKDSHCTKKFSKLVIPVKSKIPRTLSKVKFVQPLNVPIVLAGLKVPHCCILNSLSLSSPSLNCHPVIVPVIRII